MVPESRTPATVHREGFGCALPTGEGLFAFSTLEQALEALDAVQSDYRRHCQAAQEIAEHYLRAETVLGLLLAALEGESDRAGGADPAYGSDNSSSRAALQAPRLSPMTSSTISR